MDEQELRKQYLLAGVPENYVEYYIQAIREGRPVASPEEIKSAFRRTQSEDDEDSAYGDC